TPNSCPIRFNGPAPCDTGAGSKPIRDSQAPNTCSAVSLPVKPQKGQVGMGRVLGTKKGPSFSASPARRLLSGPGRQRAELIIRHDGWWPVPIAGLDGPEPDKGVSGHGRVGQPEVVG